MQTFPEILAGKLANGFFAKHGRKTLVGYDLVASFKTLIYLTIVIFGCTGHHLVSMTLALEFRLPSLF